MKIRELQKALEETIFVGESHKLGIFQELHKEPDTADGLAGRLGFDKRCTWVLLEALTEMGYILFDGTKYRVAGEAVKRLVETGGPHYEGDFWNFLLYLIDPWRTLPYVLKHGKPDQSSYKGLSMTDFIRSMDSPWKKRIAPEIVTICLAHGDHYHSAIDIGGAPGTLAKEFVRQGIITTVFDLPQSLNVTRDELSGIENIIIADGDATEALPDFSYDICFLGNICHGQSPEDNAGIIQMCYDRTNSGGITVVFDNLRDESYLGATLALHMITQSPKGNIYSRDQYLQWFSDAGFQDLSVEKLSDPAWQLVIGHKK